MRRWLLRYQKEAPKRRASIPSHPPIREPSARSQTTLRLLLLACEPIQFQFVPPDSATANSDPRRTMSVPLFPTRPAFADSAEQSHEVFLRRDRGQLSQWIHIQPCFAPHKECAFDFSPELHLYVSLDVK